jgi:hypothetical protein
MKTSYSSLDRYRAFTLIELIILMAILAVVVVFVGPCKTNFSHGTGTKVGQVVKLSKQGWLRDTWEGQIVRGGLNAGSGGFSTVPFDFTVESEDLAKRVDELMRQQTEVVISYRTFDFEVYTIFSF